jgi:hypothetical protein
VKHRGQKGKQNKTKTKTKRVCTIGRKQQKIRDKMETTTKAQVSFKKFPTYKTLQFDLEDSKH